MSSTEYRKILFSFDKNFSVKAGAGSGKTSSLVELIDSILQGRTSLGETSIGGILAMTFTELAAGEMKERVCSMIDRRIAALADESSDSEELWKWRETRREFAGADISTINSFCLKILKENPYEAGLMSVDTIDEIMAGEMLDRACSSVLLNAFESGGMEILTGSFSFMQLKRAVVGTYNAAREIMELPMLRSVTEESLARIEDKCRESVIPLLERLCEAISDIEAYLSDPKNQKKKTVVTLLLAMPKLKAFYEKYRLLSSLDGLSSGIEVFYEELNAISSLKLPNTIPQIRESISDIQGKSENREICIPFQIKQCLDFLFGNIRRAVFAFLSLIDALSDEYERMKKDVGGLDFSDQIILARKLLLENLNIRRKYKQKFKFVAVDEFQDVNRRQNDVVLLLCEKNGAEKDYLAGGLPAWKADMMSFLKDGTLELEKKLFIVGDLKQAIYGFRGGDISVFSDMLEYMNQSSSCSKMDFSENFRTLDSIICPLNMFFAEIMPEQFERASSETAGDELTAERKSPDGMSAFEIVTLDKTASEPEAAARWLINSLPLIDIEDKETGISRKASFGDVAMLFRASSKIKSFVAELKKAGIPYVLESGKEFYSSDEISDIMCLVRLLFAKDMRFNEAVVLRAPFCGISNSSLKAVFDFMNSASCDFFDIPDERLSEILQDDEYHSVSRFLRIFKDLKKQAPFLSPSALLKKISDDFSYLLTLGCIFPGKARIANVQKLFEIAAKFEKSSGGSAAEFIRYVDARRKNDKETEASMPDSSAVRIMTVHKSKGMEFPVVLLCDTDHTPGHNKNSDNFPFSRSEGAAVRIKGGDGRTEGNIFASLVSASEKSRSDSESMRLLYVAATRARDYFAAIVKKDSNSNMKDGNWGSCFRYFVNKMGAVGDSSESDCVFPESYLGLQYNDGPKFSIKISEYNRNAKDLKSDVIPSGDSHSYVLPDNLDEEIASAISPEMARSRMLYMTPSKLLTWKLCKRRYLYETFRESGEGAFRGTQPLSGPFDDDALAKGSLAHAILQDVDFSCRFNDNDLPYADYLRKSAGKETEALLKIIGDEDISPECVAAVRRDISSFFNFPDPLKDYFRPDSSFMPEHKIYFSAGAGTEVYVDGVIDLVVMAADGRIAVIDYKYGRNSRDKASFYEDQLKMYCLGISKAEGIDISNIRAFLVFLRDGAEVREVDVSNDSLASFEDYLEKTAADILSTLPSEDSCQQNRELCRYLSCPYLDRCSAADESV